METWLGRLGAGTVCPHGFRRRHLEFLSGLERWVVRGSFLSLYLLSLCVFSVYVFSVCLLALCSLSLSSLSLSSPSCLSLFSLSHSLSLNLALSYALRPPLSQPLETHFPYSLVSSISVEKTGGYDHCGKNATMWAQHAGDVNYNLLNECCQAMNSRE